MKTRMPMFILLLFSLFLYPFSPTFAASAPPAINEIIEELAEVEEGFENNSWQEALEAAESIEKHLNDLLSQAKLEDEQLVLSLDNLKAALQAKNEEKSEINYLIFQKKFFSFLDNFTFEEHPLFSLINKYVVDEAAEALENDDFDDVASEMAEAGNLIKHVEPILFEQGISKQEVKEFTAAVVAVIQAAKKKNKQLTSEQLARVQDIFKSLENRAQ